MRVPERLIRHACVVLVAVCLPVVAPHVIRAAGGAGVSVPSVDGVQASAAIESRAVPLLTERPAQVIRVAPGDTVESLAATFHTDAATLRWANQVRDITEPAPGTRLLVPPAAGSLVRVQRAERPSRLAVGLGLDPRVILDYNDLRDDSVLPQGSWLQVPRSVAPAGALETSLVAPSSRWTPAVPSTQHSAGRNDFPWGQCTYYVATRRNVTWEGNAASWYENAMRAGRPVGHIPVAGSIAVMWGGWYGHVAYVERVFPNGSFVVSEMNVRGVGVVDQRTFSVDNAIVGFVY